MESKIFRDFVANKIAPRVSFPNHPPCVLFPRRLRQLAYHYTQRDTEFAWLGTAVEVSPRQFLLTEFIPTIQEASSEHVTLLRQGVSDLLKRWGAEGDEGETKINSLRCWHQSHHRYPVNPSKIDDTTFEYYRDQKLPWFIQGIFNASSQVDFKLFLDGGDIVIEHADWYPVDELDLPLARLAEAQIADNLKVVPVPKTDAKGEAVHE